MIEDNGDGIGSFATDMDKMDWDPVNLRAKLREAVDERNLRKTSH